MRSASLHHGRSGRDAATLGPLAKLRDVYGLEWDANEIKWYVDGVLVRSSPNTHWRQSLTMNFDSETMPDWFGMRKDADLPSTFSIEYVRAWKQSRNAAE